MLAKLDSNNEQSRAVIAEALQPIVLMLCPIVPHISHYLWPALGGEGDHAERVQQSAERQ